MKKTLFIAALLCTAFVFSQEKTPPKPFKTELYGFARVDYSIDTRQSAQVREFHLNLWPLDKKN